MLDAPERAGQPGRPNPWADGRWDRLRRPALQSAPEVPAGPQPSAWSALWEPAGVLTIFLKHALDAVQQRWHVRDIRSTRISIRAQSPRRKFMARQIDLICAPQLTSAKKGTDRAKRRLRAVGLAARPRWVTCWRTDRLGVSWRSHLGRCRGQYTRPRPGPRGVGDGACCRCVRQ